jgi:hypothetical protein
MERSPERGTPAPEQSRAGGDKSGRAEYSTATWTSLVATLFLSGLSREAAAQTAPATAHIEVSGAFRRSNDGSSRFYFSTPTQLEIRLDAHLPDNRVLVLWMQRNGAGFPRPGRYAVARGTAYEPPADSTLFQILLQDQGRWVMDSGAVTIESADTLQVTGRLSARSEPAGGGELVRVTARFTARYDRSKSLGLPPSRQPKHSPVQPPGTPILLFVILEAGVEARFDTLRLPARPKGGETRYLKLERRSGDTLRFEVKAGPEYKNALATVADTLTAAKGAVLLRGSTTIIASADRDVRLRAANRGIYDLYREQLTTKDPVGLANRVICETRRMIQVHGDSAHELMAEAEFLAVDPLRDEAAINRFERALAGRMFSMECDTTPTGTPKPPR